MFDPWALSDRVDQDGPPRTPGAGVQKEIDREARRLRLTGRISRIDRKVIVWVARFRRRPITVIMRLATKLGNPSSVAVITVIIALLGEQWRRTAAAFGIAAIAGGVSAQLIKRVIGRERPNVRIEGFVSIAGNPDKFSFPSGHSATAFAVAAAMFAHPSGIGWIVLPIASLIALSRVYLGAHYPFDVLAGVAVGAAVGSVVRALIF